ncbi:MAG TPA: DHHA1 domain-containing protein, partial [Candidatus Bathyarchaeia archaeon]
SGLEEKLRNLPPTRTLYYEDPYETSFRAKVIARPTQNTVVLDQTFFYPQGGGQPGDLGEIRFGLATVKVVDVQKFEGTIVHFLDGPVQLGTDLAEGEIDWDRRQSLMRHHTSTHALLGAARRVLGEHVWQAGAQKDVETSRLDITHYRGITERERDRIERLVNQVILRNLPVQANWLTRERAEAKYGFRLYQGGAVPGSKIRVVRIPGWDVEACGGTHCKRTGELGVFKIVKVDRLQDGVERIIFSAGESALKQIKKQDEIVSKASEALGVPAERLPDAVKGLVDERDRLAKELKKLQAKELESKVKRLVRHAKPLGPVRMVLTREARRKQVGAVEFANLLKETAPDIVAVVFEVSDKVQVIAAAGDAAVGAGVNASEIVSAVSRILGGGGGGRPFFATGGGPGKENLENAMTEAEQVVTRQLAAKTAQPVG